MLVHFHHGCVKNISKGFPSGRAPKKEDEIKYVFFVIFSISIDLNINTTTNFMFIIFCQQIEREDQKIVLEERRDVSIPPLPACNGTTPIVFIVHTYNFLSFEHSNCINTQDFSWPHTKIHKILLQIEQLIFCF